MALAADDVRWTAAPADYPPRQWGDVVSGEVRLKDTRTNKWPNRLVRNNHFVYCLPRAPRSDWERQLVRHILEVVRRERHVVRLFATPGSRNESYGAWRCVSVRTLPASLELDLKRLEHQDGKGTKRPREEERSANEARHHDLLRRLFPEWTVRHEPETLLDLHEPTVVDGVSRRNDDVARSYTCDFVVSKGFRRFCVESKPCESHVTEAAVSKARLLRDRTLSQVVFLVGEGDASKWYDLERWYDTETFVARTLE